MDKQLTSWEDPTKPKVSIFSFLYFFFLPVSYSFQPWNAEQLGFVWHTRAKHMLYVWPTEHNPIVQSDRAEQSPIVRPCPTERSIIIFLFLNFLLEVSNRIKYLICQVFVVFFVSNIV